MSFTKRYISKEFIVERYNTQGYNGLMNFIRSNTIITTDDFSQQIVGLITHTTIPEDEKFIGVSLKIKEYGKL